MKRVAWLTDLHLNFVVPAQIRAFLAEVAAAAPDVVLIGGDIGDGHSLIQVLQVIDQSLQRPVYFVLGNHDYYHSSIAGTRRMVRLLSDDLPFARWLPAVGVIELTPGTALLGHGGWADGRLGNFANSHVILNDYILIEELARVGRADRLKLLNDLGDEAADYVRGVLLEAFESYGRVILLTHVPPFKEACWHEGGLSDDNYLPHFTCQAMGAALREVMLAFPDRDLTVLCGHTHGQGETRILENLLVLTGGAEYGKPAIQRVFEVDQA